MQTYNGWARLAKATGWVLAVEQPSGRTVLSPLELPCAPPPSVQQPSAQELRSERMQKALWSFHAMHGALVDYEEVMVREDALLDQQEANEEVERVLLGRLSRAQQDGDEAELRACADALLAAGLADDARRARAASKRVAEQKSRKAPDAGQASLLSDLAQAAASGDPAAIRAARDAAKKGGVPTREVARTVALHAPPPGT